MPAGEVGMDSSSQDLVGHLFAVATAILEDAAEISFAGQSRRYSIRRLVRHTALLKARARDINAIACTVEALVQLDKGDTRKTEKRRNSRL
jgi:hypothetical protein